MSYHLAARMQRLKASPIRSILSVANRPGMISFAGGLPSADSFPEAASLRFEQEDLQYGPSDGEPYLRQRISDELRARGLTVLPSQIMILSGSQQGIDLVAKLMIDKDTPVAIESPTYLAALQVFSLFGARYLPYEIEHLDELNTDTPPALIYTNPTFQNPSSKLYSRLQRKKLAALCDECESVLFEDDPYHELSYEPGEQRPVCSYIKQTHWVYQSSFSKTMAPGLRLGYLACSEALFPMLLKLKQAADLHSSRISQRIAMQLLDDYAAADRVVTLQNQYRSKRDLFDESLHRHFADLATWSVPAGGLFFWLTLKSPMAISTSTLLPQAIDAGVTFMPGEPFFADGRQHASSFRLNFSHADSADFDRGLKLLADIFRGAQEL